MSIRGVTTSENEAFLGIRLPNFLIDLDEGINEREDFSYLFSSTCVPAMSNRLITLQSITLDSTLTILPRRETLGLCPVCLCE